MSPSPQALRGGEDLDRYLAGWDATMRLMREGRSWSGHERNVAFLNCGAVAQQSKIRNPKSKMPPVPFANISAVSGLDFADDGRAMSLVDWDHDGDLDVWLYNRTGPRLRLMINRTTSPGSAEAPRSVAFRLQGTKSNRDAIGARVEVILEDAPHNNQESQIKNQKSIQTLRAGDGFLSQSSKWLHFGLGADASIREVVVRWPGGVSERFAKVRPGGRYRLVQGSGVAVEAGARRQAVRLAPSAQRVVRPADGPRVVVPVRLVAPLLEYVRFGESSPQAIEPASKPLLVNLWAAWCAPCVAELKALTARRDELRSAGVDVVALSVDGLAQDRATTPADAQDLLSKLRFPFDAGLATPALLKKLRVLMAALFKVRRPDGVPMSFLFDRRGRLAVIYRGPVEIDALLSDVASIDVAPGQLWLRSAPLRGRWYTPPNLRWAMQTTASFENRYPHDAVQYIRTAIEERPPVTADASRTERHARQRRMELALLHARLQMALVKLNRTAEAIESFQIAARYDTENAQLHFGVAGLLARARRWEKAREQYLHTLRIEADADAMIDLGAALIATGRPEEAIARYLDAVRLDPDRLIAHQNLAVALRAQGRFEESIHHCREALRIRPDDPKALTNLGLSLSAGGRRDEAVRHLRDAVKRLPGEMELQLTLGTVLQSADALDEAAAHFEEAARLDTEHAEALVRLAAVRQRQGRSDDALDAYEEALRRRPGYTDAHLELAGVLEKSGRRAEALAHLRRARELEPDRPEVLGKLAWMLATDSDADRRDPAEAVKLARRAVELTERRQPTALFTLARAQAAAGRYDLALAAAEEALEVATKAGRKDLADRIRKRLTEYRNKTG